MKIDTIKLENNLKAFTKILLKLNEDDNLVLGGSYALMLHGLNLKRLPDDVDIIIYRPTPKQIEFLESISDFNNLNELGSDYPTCVYKLKTSKKNVDYTLDILLETKTAPDNLLIFEKNNIKVKIQEISNIIEAKSSYGRTKDFEDMLSLKNLNFNR